MDQDFTSLCIRWQGDYRAEQSHDIGSELRSRRGFMHGSQVSAFQSGSDPLTLLEFGIAVAF